MTFEPIGDDEYELAATRPRPRRTSRRAERRRLAIVGAIALADGGIATASAIEHATRRAPGTLYPDLAALEHQGRIKRIGGIRGQYRVATEAERWQPEERAERIVMRTRQHPWLREGG